jgi:hypothetical protein
MTDEGTSSGRKRGNRLITYSIVVAIVAVGLGVTLLWLDYWPVRHFGVVQEGVLYRGGQPDAKALEYLITRYQIRTVVNLRGSGPGEDWWQVERDVCHKHGVRMVDVDIGNADAAVPGLRQFLTVAANAANRPIYVHCEAGSARTGYAAAAYRMVFQGWSYKQAMKEAKKFRFNRRVGVNAEYDRVLRKLAAGADWHTFGGTATSASTSAAVGAGG